MRYTVHFLWHSVGVWLGGGKSLARSFLFFSLVASPSFAQPINIVPTIVGRTNFQVSFPGSSNSYSLLLGSTNLAKPSAPAAALLGTNGTQNFQLSMTVTASRFFRVEQLPLTATNDIIGDGIPDGWKLQNGLPVFGPSQANVVPSVPPGNTNTWLQIYQASISIPSVSFVLQSSQVVEGQGTAAVQLNFNKSFNGFVSYSLAGTAVAGPGGDYHLPSGVVSVNGTNANISIQLFDDLIVKAPRTIILTLTADTASPPRYQPGSTSSHTMVIEDNDAHWEGQMTLGGLNFSLQMDLAQQGTNYQATIAGGTGFFPSGTWPVTTSITSNSFTGTVGPVAYPAAASSLGIPFTRYLNLTAWPAVNVGDVFTNGMVMAGAVTETLVYTNAYLNKTTRGSFTLRRTDTVAPTTTVPLTTITP